MFRSLFLSCFHGVVRIIHTSQVLSDEIVRLRGLLKCSKEMEDQLDSALKAYKGTSHGVQNNNYATCFPLSPLLEKLTVQWSMNTELEKVK